MQNGVFRGHLDALMASWDWADERVAKERQKKKRRVDQSKTKKKNKQKTKERKKCLR